jgi:archaetidylinositol phosphate synthase
MIATGHYLGGLSMKQLPWDQRVARVLVRPLVATSVTPNQVTVFTLLVALTGAVLIATGERAAVNWGVGLFVLARFLDHFDGELARQKGAGSRLGYYLDYLAGAGSYAALFLCIGIGLRDGALGIWALVLGLAGTSAAVLSMAVNLRLDAATGGGADTGEAVGYPGFAGFELEDGIYLLAPITWLGWLTPFFVAASIGAVVYFLWSLNRLLRPPRATA